MLAESFWNYFNECHTLLICRPNKFNCLKGYATSGEKHWGGNVRIHKTEGFTNGSFHEYLPTIVAFAPPKNATVHSDKMGF
jgi:hypothetical protein